MSLILHLIIVFAIGFNSSHAQAHTQAPTQAVEAPSQAVSQAPKLSPLAYVAPKLAARQSAQEWAYLTLEDAGVKLSPNVTLEFTNEDNCGAKLSTASLGGCTHTTAPHTYTVQVSPELAYTAWGNHILFHEIAHTLGADECAAEEYAHHFEDEPLWSYPACKAAR